MRKIDSFVAAALPATIAALTAVRLLRPIDYGDTWWHLAAGEAIWKSGAIPVVDIFSRTARLRPWLNAEWLYDWTLYGLYARFGVAGVIGLKSLLGAGIMAVLWRRLKLFCDFWFWPAAAAGLIFAASSVLWRDRSELVSVFFLSLLLLILDRARRSARLGRAFWTSPALFALWANFHGMWIAGLGAAGLWTAAGAARRRWPAGKLSLWLALCTGALLLNPYGVKLVSAVAWFSARSGHYPIYEWAPTPPGELLFWLPLLIFILSFASRWQVERRFEPASAAVGAAFAWLAARHARGVPLFLIAAFPYALENLAAAPFLRSAERLARRREKILAAGAGAALLAGLILAARAARLGVDVEKSFYAKEACDFIEAEKVPGPFYNDYPLGSYWLWRFKGNPGVFIDSRYNVVDGYDLLFDDLLASQKTPRLWDDFLARHGVSAALVRYPFDSSSLETPIFTRYFPRERWALVYWDDLCLLFLKRSRENAGVIARREFKWIEPDATAAYFAQSAASGIQRERMAEDLNRALALHPDSRRARALWAALAARP